MYGTPNVLKIYFSFPILLFQKKAYAQNVLNLRTVDTTLAYVGLM